MVLPTSHPITQGDEELWLKSISYVVSLVPGKQPIQSSLQTNIALFAFRFSIDEWMIPLYGEHMERDVFDKRLATLQDLFKESALQLFSLDVHVIFDFGFWKKADRDAFIRWASTVGVESEVHYLDVSLETCKQRALKRNADLDGKSYEMTPDMLALFWSWFEIPTSNENVVCVKPPSE